MFCKHDWKIQTERFIESNFERAARLKVPFTGNDNMDHSATHIVIMTCNKCGKVNKTVTRT